MAASIAEMTSLEPTAALLMKSRDFGSFINHRFELSK